MAVERSLIQFAREVFAAALGAVLTRERRADELPEGGFPEEFAAGALPNLGPLTPYTLTTAGQPQRIFEALVDRRRVVFQNRGAGRVSVATRQEDLAAGVDGGGVLLESGDALIDEPPDQHRGEWWAVTDAAGTKLVAGQVS